MGVGKGFFPGYLGNAPIGNPYAPNAGKPQLNPATTNPLERMQAESDWSSQQEQHAKKRYQYQIADYKAAREKAQQPYLQSMQQQTDQYTGKLQDLSNQAQAQATQAQQTYSNVLQPALQSNLEKAQEWQSTVRDQYQQAGQDIRSDLRSLMGEGAGMYGTEIEGTRQRGLADAGVLQALGAQAAGQQMQGTPMTGSQMAAIMAMQNQQAGEAYNVARQRMRDLEDQRRAYQIGQLQRMGDVGAQATMGGLGAQERAFGITGQAAGQLQAGEQNIQSILQSLRGEQQGYGAGQFQAGTQMAGTRYGTVLGAAQEDLGFGRQMYDIDLGQSQRDYGRNVDKLLTEMGEIARREDIQRAQALAEEQRRQQEKNRESGLINAILGVGGTALGAYFGGPAGAAAGGAAGKAVGDVVSPQQQTAYQPITTQQYPLATTMQQQYSPYGPYASGYQYGQQAPLPSWGQIQYS